MSATLSLPRSVSKRSNRSRRRSCRHFSDCALASNPEASKCVCCICLEKISDSDKASIDSCDHLYHKDCIESWSHIENACPLCKQRFGCIIVCGSERRIAVHKRDQEAAYHVDLGSIVWVDSECVKCGCEDNEQLLLLCDGCDAAAHTYCIGLGDSVPDTDWFCDDCQAREDRQQRRGHSPESDEEYRPSTPERVASLQDRVRHSASRRNARHNSLVNLTVANRPQNGVRRSKRLRLKHSSERHHHDKDYDTHERKRTTTNRKRRFSHMETEADSQCEYQNRKRHKKRQYSSLRLL